MDPLPCDADILVVIGRMLASERMISDRRVTCNVVLPIDAYLGYSVYRYLHPVLIVEAPDSRICAVGYGVEVVEILKCGRDVSHGHGFLDHFCHGLDPFRPAPAVGCFQCSCHELFLAPCASELLRLLSRLLSIITSKRTRLVSLLSLIVTFSCINSSFFASSSSFGTP